MRNKALLWAILLVMLAFDGGASRSQAASVTNLTPSQTTQRSKAVQRRQGRALDHQLRVVTRRSAQGRQHKAHAAATHRLRPTKGGSQTTRSTQQHAKKSAQHHRTKSTQGAWRKVARRWRRRRRRRRRRRSVRGLRRLTDIRYQTAKTFTRIVLVLSGVVQIEQGEAQAVAHKSLPTRLYVDLTPCAPIRRLSRWPLLIQDARATRIRVARNTLRTTRVVIELKQFERSRVAVLSDPVRVVIDVADKALPPRPQTTTPLPSLRPQPQVNGSTRFRRGHHQGAKGNSKRPYVLRYRGRLRLPFAFRVRSLAIDAGHGGREEGTVGRDTGLQEKVVTLDIAKRVVRLLKKRLKIKVFMTRKRDLSLSIDRRAKLVKQQGADLLVSVHINAHTSRRLQGISTYYLHWNDRFRAAKLLSSDPLVARENQGVHLRKFRDVNMILNGLRVQNNTVISKVLAVAIQRQMMRSVRKQYTRVRNLGVRRGLFYLLYAAGVPAVLVEASYLSNPFEEKLLKTSKYRQRVALGIANGIANFVRITNTKRRTASPQPRQAAN